MVHYNKQRIQSSNGYPDSIPLRKSLTNAGLISKVSIIPNTSSDGRKQN